MIEVMSKVDEVINAIDNDISIKRLKYLKSIIDKDSEIQNLLTIFNTHKKEYGVNLIINEELKIAKEELYNHPVVYEYRKLYSELSISLARFNRSILKILDTNNYICGSI